MKELKDIVLKKGDIVYLDNGEIVLVNTWEGTPTSSLDYIVNITKIERPVKYETIYEAPKQILDEEEKEWLENFLRPFRDRVEYISLRCWGTDWKDFIEIGIENDDNVGLPSFNHGTMYKGMELSKEYTLEELGLFEE